MQDRDFERIFTHMEWADALTWTAALKVPAAERDANLRERLHHLHSVQWAYLQCWRGEGISVPELEQLPDLPAIAAWAAPYYGQLKAFTGGLEPGALSREQVFPWSAEVVKRYGSCGPTTLVESAMQVVLHTTYHRGQIATRVRELGGEPPLTDFIVWLWKNRPAPEWPALGAV